MGKSFKILMASFTFLLFCFSLYAQTKMEQVLEISVEISFLQKQLEHLENSVHGQYRQEMVEELYSQRNLRAYAWSSFSQHLERAESFEENARQDEKLAQAIKARLRALAEQINQLEPN